MKRIITLFLILSMCLSLFCTVTVANAAEGKKFADIEGHWAKEDIEKLIIKGIISGISETEFAPDNVISRAEFLSLVIRAIDAKAISYAGGYRDIDGSEWYADAVQTAKNLGIIDVAFAPNDRFKPNESVTREEMASIIVRAYEYKAKEKAPSGDIKMFADKSKISPWAFKYVESAYALGIIKGISETEFSPKAFTTRAQAAVIIRRLLTNTKIGKTIKIFSIGNSFSVDATRWLYQVIESYGYDNIIIGVLHYDNCDLEMHDLFIKNDSPEYVYKKNCNGTWVDTYPSDADTAMKDEVWDTVVIGHAPAKSGMTVEFNPFFENIVKYVKENSLNPDITIGFHMTWAYPADSDSYGFPHYNNDQMTMYREIVSATQKEILTKNYVDYIIPSGTAIQNARSSYVGDTLNRDGCHLSEYLGRYIAALTWFNTITGTSVADVKYVPDREQITEKMQRVAVESVVNAVKTPYAVTQSTITE